VVVVSFEGVDDAAHSLAVPAEEEGEGRLAGMVLHGEGVGLLVGDVGHVVPLEVVGVGRVVGLRLCLRRSGFLPVGICLAIPAPAGVERSMVLQIPPPLQHHARLDRRLKYGRARSQGD